VTQGKAVIRDLALVRGAAPGYGVNTSRRQACLLAGSTRHSEQAFGLYRVNVSLATMAVQTLVLPNIPV
jgi:hypothetical protein